MTRNELVAEVKKLQKQKLATAPIIQEVLGCSTRVAKRFAKVIKANGGLPVEAFDETLATIRANLKEDEEAAVVAAYNGAKAALADAEDAEDDEEAPIGDEAEWKTKYDVADPYYFNTTTQKYVVFLKSKGGYIEVPK
jgi:hypothetical protein